MWLREDEELRTVVRDHFVKGKGALWCIEKQVNPELTQADEAASTSKCCKTTCRRKGSMHIEAIRFLHKRM